MKSLLTLVSALIIFLTSSVIASMDDRHAGKKLSAAKVPSVLLVCSYAESDPPAVQEALRVSTASQNKLEFSYPDVSETYRLAGVAMVLKLNR